MIHRLCVGIDVGLSSAAAAVYGYAAGAAVYGLARANHPRLISTTPIKTVGEDGARRIDVEWLRDWLLWSKASIAYVENATAMPDPNPDPRTGLRARMGAGTMARYLRACGAIEATVTLAGLDSVLVTPTTWKRALGLLKTGKNASVDLMRELFPEHASTTFRYYKSHNIADAVGIAIYGALRCELVKINASAS